SSRNSWQRPLTSSVRLHVNATENLITRMTRLELDVLAKALSSHADPHVRDLFYIIPNLHVAEREFTRVGFYTKFSPNESLRRAGLDDAHLAKHPPEAIGLHPNLAGVVNFLLWIRNGQIDCLVAASSGSWPEDEAQFVISSLPSSAA